MTRLSVGLLSSASYLSCPFRKDPRTLKRGSLGTGGRRVATKPTPSPSASSNWAVLSLLPPLSLPRRCHFFLSPFLLILLLRWSLFSRFFHFSFSFSLVFHSRSISPRQRSISDAYYQRYSFSRPTPFQRAAFFSLFLSLSRLCLYLPVNVSPLLERIPSFVDTRFLPPVNPPLRHLDWFMGTWRRGSLSSRLSSRVPSSRACRHFWFLDLWKNIYSKYLNEDDGAWTSFFLSLCLSLAFGDNELSWWFIEKVFRIFWGIVHVWLGIGSNYYAYSFIRCFEWYSQLDENNLSNLK